MRKEDMMAGIILIIISILLFIETLKFPSPPVQSSGPSFWPRLLLIILIILATILIVKALRNRVTGEAAIVETAVNPEKKKKIIKPVGGILTATLFVLLFKPLGFLLSTFLFLVALVNIIQFDLRPKRFLISAVKSSIMVGMIYLIFDVFLKVNLPSGSFF